MIIREPNLWFSPFSFHLDSTSFPEYRSKEKEHRKELETAYQHLERAEPFHACWQCGKGIHGAIMTESRSHITHRRNRKAERVKEINAESHIDKETDQKHEYIYHGIGKDCRLHTRGHNLTRHTYRNHRIGVHYALELIEHYLEKD